MANSTGTNPMRMEAAGTVWAGTPKNVRLIQWVDDAGDIVNASSLVLTLNGCTLTTVIQLEVTANYGTVGAVIWEMGPFNPGISISDFVVTTMATGHLHIWVD